MQIQVHQTATTMTQEHPLTAKVFPRFTPQEAIILNMIASASPGYVTPEALTRKLGQVLAHQPYAGPSHTALLISISSIRAKIGERKYHPRRLISVYEMQENGNRGALLGYCWKG